MIRRLFLSLLVLLCLAIVAVAGLGLVALQTEPLVAKMTPPTSEEVTGARGFVRELRGSIGRDTQGPSEFTTTDEELHSLIKLGARVVPGFRGDLSRTGEALRVRGSLPLSAGGFRRWLNVSAVVPAFQGGVTLDEVQLGPLTVPGALALGLTRAGGNLVVGNGFGDTVVDAARSLRLEPEQLVFTLEMGEMGTNGVMRGVFGSLRGSEMPEPGKIMGYYRSIRRAMDDGTLPTTGSYLPYVQFTLRAARAGAEWDGPDDAYTAAIFALALACGAKDFSLIVGGLFNGANMAKDDWQASCSKVTFNGRIDSRRHFTTAAAIQAASNRGFAVSVGEFKELFDAQKSGGFDFTDIAANNSGIRMSNLIMATDLGRWPGLIARIQTENDVIVPFDGIPQIMSEADFLAQYGNVESPAYLARLADIETRIDQLALHQ